MSEVLIYNLGGGQVLGRVSLGHAIRMLHRRVAAVREAVEGESFGPYQRPVSVELVRYVHSRWVYDRTGRVPYSRAALLRRDKNRCGYCGAPATTMDHVVPRCQGGTTTWLNAVAACEPCNSAKAGRTPQEAGMSLRSRPFEPVLADVYPYGKR
ncbi:HNH endonuclease [Oerskovia jenensis]|uniref:5-methylcytosine-specific restriction endonuclease McrA n=1 Tax=Oerskovia jenensis TaxID=162169 RepID=A0ABS2LAN1_9CELL|nr:HNH endonuclease [Oerskovia jenensis]MBM7477377.1 5-methylcytosine-specific restriction endonuclease McrA [Oerskovia jenensis]